MLYFVLLTALAVGEGDAAGEGLAVPGFDVGGVAVSLAGEEDVAGDVVLTGVLLFAAGSHAAARAMTTTVVNKSAIRLVRFSLGLFISFASWEQDRKSGS